MTASLDPSGCSLTTHYEVVQVAYPDGTQVSDYACHWEFDDGKTSDFCAGEHTFANPGFHSGAVFVSDADSAATGSDDTGLRPIWDELAIDVVAEAPACGLQFSYSITKTGGKPSGGWYFVSIQPWQNVITQPEPGASSGTIQVSAPVPMRSPRIARRRLRIRSAPPATSRK